MKNLAMHIMDIMQNSIGANAKRIGIEICENRKENTLRLTFSDDGSGMNRQQTNMATDPFFTTRTTRKVGLGLSLLKQRAEETGGWLNIHSVEGKGTTVSTQFVRDHIDRPVLGDIPGTVALLMTSNPAVRFKYIHTLDHLSYSIDSGDIVNALGGIPIDEPAVNGLIKEMIRENLVDIGIDLNA